MKISNLKWHYETKHRNFEETFPQNSEVSTTYQAAGRILVTSIHNEIKKCMTEVMDTMFEGKQKEEIFNYVF